jgi:hypothetical protein
MLPPSGLTAKPAWLLPGPPSELARFPFAPRCCSVSSLSNGSPFQVRYASVGSLFLKPLGTFFTMIPIGDFVNRFLRFARVFQQDISCLFSDVYEGVLLDVL